MTRTNDVGCYGMDQIKRKRVIKRAIVSYNYILIVLIVMNHAQSFFLLPKISTRVSVLNGLVSIPPQIKVILIHKWTIYFYSGRLNFPMWEASVLKQILEFHDVKFDMNIVLWRMTATLQNSLFTIDLNEINISRWQPALVSYRDLFQKIPIFDIMRFPISDSLIINIQICL